MSLGSEVISQNTHRFPDGNTHRVHTRTLIIQRLSWLIMKLSGKPDKIFRGVMEMYIAGVDKAQVAPASLPDDQPHGLRDLRLIHIHMTRITDTYFPGCDLKNTIAPYSWPDERSA